MKKAVVKICIFMLAFGVGMVSFSLYATYKESLSQKPITAVAPPVTKLKYTPASLACKSPCAHIYELPDGRILAEGMACYASPSEATFKLSESLAPTTPIEAAPNPSDTLSKEKGRFTVAFPPDESGRRRFEVVHYAGGECYYYVNAPSLAIAFDFEKCKSQTYQLNRQRLSNKPFEMTPR